MILDTSAVLAVLFKEEEATTFASLITKEAYVGITTSSLVETGIVVGHQLGFQTNILTRFLQAADIRVIPFTEQHWFEAVRAYERFGKGRHPAKLNLGDCFTYAVAKFSKHPLLCKGNDFAQTDLTLVNYET